MPLRERKRTISAELKKKIAERAVQFFNNDNEDRQIEMDLRAQRYAKFRQWKVTNDHSPWDNSSDATVSDMARTSLKMQDTLYNAIISTRPTLLAKATNKKDLDKQESIDQVLDYQAFVENGETWISDLVDAFVNDGHFTAFVPWVDERRMASTVKVFPILPPEQEPLIVFTQILEAEFPDHVEIEIAGPDGWDYIVTVEEDDRLIEIKVSFYTDERDKLEMITLREAKVFEGNKIIIKDRADVFHPTHVANLQAPGPSNPGGASHVGLVDRLTVDEVRRLQASGFYDELSKEDADTLDRTAEAIEEHPEEEQKSIIQGANANPHVEHPEENLVTRLLIFDVMDLGKGFTEDVVYWVLEDKKLVCRVRRLSEAFPSRTPRRPLAEEQSIPVRGRRTGIGQLELIEGLHDLAKQTLDQAVDFGSLLLTPWGFYRPASSLRPEQIRLSPGDLYPTSDPKNDVHFPALPTGGEAYAFNMLTLLNQEEERLTQIGDLQLGRVPKGKASALRTVGGQQMIAAQGQSRPERLLRRLFHGLGQIWTIMHENNIHFLEGKKEIRIHTSFSKGSDPYRTVDSKNLNGVVEFEFQANAFNISKESRQEALGQIGAGLTNNPLMLQAGVVDQIGLHKWGEDWVQVWGQEPDDYLAPLPQGDVISFEDALLSIMNNEVPNGIPREGPMGHLQLLQEFQNSDNFAFLDETQLQIFEQWTQIVLGFLQQQMQQQQLAQSAQGQGQQEGQAEGSVPPDNEQAPVQENELIDEQLPSAGGGASGT